MDDDFLYNILFLMIIFVIFGSIFMLFIYGPIKQAQTSGIDTNTSKHKKVHYVCVPTLIGESCYYTTD